MTNTPRPSKRSPFKTAPPINRRMPAGAQIKTDKDIDRMADIIPGKVTHSFVRPVRPAEGVAELGVQRPRLIDRQQLEPVRFSIDIDEITVFRCVLPFVLVDKVRDGFVISLDFGRQRARPGSRCPDRKVSSAGRIEIIGSDDPGLKHGDQLTLVRECRHLL